MNVIKYLKNYRVRNIIFNFIEFQMGIQQLIYFTIVCVLINKGQKLIL